MNQMMKPHDLVATAREFVPVLKERSDEIEKARHIPQDLADQMSAAGLYRALLPSAYGGIEMDPVSYVEMIRVLATADASAAWCVFIGGTTGITAAYLDPDVAKEIYATPETIMSGVFAPTGRAQPEGDHYRVSGQWQWGSGSQNADWISGGCFVMQDGKPEMSATGVPISRMMIMPKEEIEFLDTWHVSGLCGTGSTDYKVTDVLVPKGRSVALGYDTAIDRPLYKFPVFSLLAAGISSVALGIGRAAIDELVGFASAKTPQGTLKPLANRPDTQVNVARAEALVRSAECWLKDAVANAWAEAQSDGPISLEARREMRLAMAHATTSSAEAVDLVYSLGGGTSVYHRSPLQRHFRDVHVATQHMMVAKGVLEQSGRLFLGLETDTTLF